MLRVQLGLQVLQVIQVQLDRQDLLVLLDLVLQLVVLQVRYLLKQAQQTMILLGLTSLVQSIRLVHLHHLM